MAACAGPPPARPRRPGVLLAGLIGLAALVASLPGRAAERDPLESMRLDIMGTVSVHAPDLSAFPRWRAALAEVEPWLARMAACAERPCPDLSLPEKVWLNRIQGLSRLPPDRLARAVATFLDDLLALSPEAIAAEHVGPWPTMQNLLAGDGRDGLGRALARYYTLRAAGLDPDHVRLIVARDTLTLETTHVVLVETPQVQIAMTRYGVHRPDSGREHAFVPVYAFDHSGRWLYFPETVLDEAAPAPSD
ncbi:hypothetical protein [Roseospira goensis]|uniref:Uncharacterized protein n=1 Tax=Roseospira goensis TaxID=391922 RepID=A0A7W6RYK7_9PROT|nr:hypothetical protein [Roseospira goensis]MBB4284937.1 hypothetical protein [Roseospira goensis]